MAPGGASSKNNVLPLWGNEKTMNLNNLILTNIQSSHYFKVNLFELKTYHEVIDEIYYKVAHLEPWEKGSRKTSGQTGMCGGVRGVGAGGIVSTAFCLLYKLFTLKLTRKQVNGLLTHCDSPYIRALGFMYIRYTQPPADLWDWYEGYLDDEEELDVKAGGGCTMTIGEMLRHYLTKLEWYSTLFPRIPVPIQKDLERKLMDHGPMMKAMSRNNGIEGPGGGSGGGGTAAANYNNNNSESPGRGGSTNDFKDRHITDEEVSWGEAERIARLRRSPSREKRSKEDGERRKHGGEHRSNGERSLRERSDERDRSGRRDAESGGERRHEHRERRGGDNRDHSPPHHHHHHHHEKREKFHRERSRSRDRRQSQERNRHHRERSRHHRERSHHRRSRSRSNERFRVK